MRREGIIARADAVRSSRALSCAGRCAQGRKGFQTRIGVPACQPTV
jgi:hypothetical protein